MQKSLLMVFWERWGRKPLPEGNKKMSEIKPAVGMILYSSWGYDQTNIDFYKIVRVSDKGTVWIQELAKEIVEVVHWAGQEVVPVDQPAKVPAGWDEEGKREWEDAPINRHKWKTYGVSLNSYSGAWVWDGKPKLQTQTA